MKEAVTCTFCVYRHTHSDISLACRTLIKTFSAPNPHLHPRGRVQEMTDDAGSRLQSKQIRGQVESYKGTRHM